MAFRILMRHSARLLLLTGQRLREVAESTWDEIDLAKRLWTIPAERMKADAPHVVPLSGGDGDLQACPGGREIHLFRQGWLSPNERVFRYQASDRCAHARRLAMDVSRFARTMRTGLSALRVPDIVAELVISHTQKGLHKTYDQHAYLDERRHAFEAWANRVMSIVEPAAPSNVVTLAARG